MSALSAEASQNLSTRHLSPALRVPDRAQMGKVVSIDPDVTFIEFWPDNDTPESKSIAYMGISELSRRKQLWRVAMRIGGSHMLIGSRNDTVEDLHERALQSETEHPGFYKDLLTDIAATMKNRNQYKPLEEWGLMDFVWVMGDTKSNLQIIHPSRRQPFNEGARAYTTQLLHLIISS